MARTILILEDDDDRRQRFAQVAAALGCASHFWYDAHAMIAEFDVMRSECAAVSLDCDLIPPDGSEAWGDGILVAEYLATVTPVAPVIVHSTNRDGSRRMMALLGDAGWAVHRVAPIGDDWIEQDWRMEVQSAV
ncbi:MAG: hypothetical protein H6818_08760 [Phycisphaerales bacterium]|nr:hypothetical protein [Phycisphaerales bacterium]